MALAVFQAMTAGALVRRGCKLRLLILDYLQVTVPGYGVMFMLYALCFSTRQRAAFDTTTGEYAEVATWPGNLFVLMLWCSIGTLAVVGVKRRLRWPLRVSLFLAFFLLFAITVESL